MPLKTGHAVLDEEAARLSSLKHANMNFLDRYSFLWASRPTAGLRVLRAPTTVDPEEGGYDGRGGM
jgi:hypothetical protein